MKFAFFGTPRRATLVLEELKKEGVMPSLIITTPDKPQGRKYVLTPSPVKEWADTNAVPTLQPQTLDADFRAELEKTQWDIFVVVSYGKVLPKWLFDMPRRGTLNVHFSALPLYRGASPVIQQVLDGVTKTATTIILMDEEVDHGPIVTQEFFSVPQPIPTTGELIALFAQKTGPLLAKTINDWTAEIIQATEQDHDRATFTQRVRKDDAEIDLSDSDLVNFRKIQAYTPRPGPYFFTERNGKKMRIKITRAAFKDSELVIQRVIPEGKKETDYKTFVSTLQ